MRISEGSMYTYFSRSERVIAARQPNINITCRQVSSYNELVISARYFLNHQKVCNRKKKLTYESM